MRYAEHRHHLELPSRIVVPVRVRPEDYLDGAARLRPPRPTAEGGSAVTDIINRTAWSRVDRWLGRLPANALRKKAHGPCWWSERFRTMLTHG